MNRPTLHRLPAVACMAALLAGLLLAGCGGGGSSSSTTEAAAEGETAGSSGGGSSSFVAAVKEAKQEVAELETPSSFEYPAPTEPVEPGNHKVAIISVGQNSPSGKSQTEYAEEAAKTMGWESETFDSEGNVAKYANYIGQVAQSGEFDALIIESLDVSNFKSAVEEALANNIVVSCISACDVSGVLHNEITDTGQNYEKEGEGVGAYILANAGETPPKVVGVKSAQFPATVERIDGVEKYLKEHCPECEFSVGSDVLVEEVAEPGPPFWTAYLSSNPEGSAAEDYVQGLGDSAGTATQAKTEVQSGRHDITISGFDAFPEFVQLLTEGEKWPVGTTTTSAFEYEAWSAMDLAARQIAGVPIWKGANELPASLVTAKNVGDFKNPQNFVPPEQANFKQTFAKLWGKG